MGDEEEAATAILENLKAKPPVTAPIDPRHPNTNQAKYCFSLFNKHLRCNDEKGEDDPMCVKYRRWTADICPPEWRELWEEKVEEHAFPRPNVVRAASGH